MAQVDFCYNSYFLTSSVFIKGMRFAQDWLKRALGVVYTGGETYTVPFYVIIYTTLDRT